MDTKIDLTSIVLFVLIAISVISAFTLPARLSRDIWIMTTVVIVAACLWQEITATD